MHRPHPLRLASGLALAATLAFSGAAAAQDDMVGQVEQTPVSYTHLTLPTTSP